MEVRKQGFEHESYYNDGFLWNINTVESYTLTAKERTLKIGEYLNLGELSVIGTYNIGAILLAKNTVPLKYMYDVETADAGYEKTGTTEGGINVFENMVCFLLGFW